MSRWARKRDDNERAIVLALRDVGASVTQLDAPGVPDLLVGFRGATWLLEVKVSSRADGKAHTRTAQGGRGELTEAQVAWWAAWCGSPIAVVHDVAEAMRAIGAQETQP